MNINFLIWSEQGIGDQIMFSRFFKQFKNYRGKIFSLLNPKLKELLKQSFPFINFVQKLEQDEFDFHLPIASLGEFLFKVKRIYLKIQRLI